MRVVWIMKKMVQKLSVAFVYLVMNMPYYHQHVWGGLVRILVVCKKLILYLKTFITNSIRDEAYEDEPFTVVADGGRSAMSYEFNRKHLTEAYHYPYNHVTEGPYCSYGQPSLKNARVRFIQSYTSQKYSGGTIVWTGLKEPNYEEVVVLKLDEDMDGMSDGVFDGQRLVAAPKDGRPCYIMLPKGNIEILPRFELGDYCNIVEIPFGPHREGGFIRFDDGHCKRIHFFHTNYANGRVKAVSYNDYNLQKAPPPECDSISSTVQAIDGQQFDLFLGRNKGIQGQQNSCYLDTLLFSLFAFSNDFSDDYFNCDISGKDTNYCEAMDILRYEIVYPLRAYHFVSHNHVRHLRNLMAHCTKQETFKTGTRDIPECIDALFGQILQWKYLVSIGNTMNGQLHFNDAFALDVININNLPFPTTKDLLDQSATKMEFCIKETPQCLPIQIARSNNERFCVIPNLNLDLRNLLPNTVKVCCQCKCNATLQFLNSDFELDNSFYCEECAMKENLNLNDGCRLPEPVISSISEENTEMSLDAVICIERSHYNCFVRCRGTDRWVFFDSMHHQETLFNPTTKKDETFNIPLVEEVPKFREWILKAQKLVKRERNLATLFNNMSPEESDKAKRLLYCPYLMIYRKDVSCLD